MIETHLKKLSVDELKHLYQQDLPPSIAENPSKENMLDLIRSGFFQLAKSNLNDHLNKHNGMGYLLSQTFKYDYTGEGIVNFLNGIREATKKERNQQKKQDDN